MRLSPDSVVTPEDHERGRRALMIEAAVNPQAVVPTLVLDDGGPPLFQSLAILEYLEETNPHAPLLPKDARGRARVHGLALIVAADGHPPVVPRIRAYLERELRLDEPARNRWLTHWTLKLQMRPLRRADRDASSHESAGRDAVTSADKERIMLEPETRRRIMKLRFIAGAAALAACCTPAVAQTTINLTAIDGYPPRALWIKEFINFYIPEVDKRLARDGQYKIRWNQAWGGQIVKPQGVLEGLQKGLGDIGIVTTAIYGDKMRIMAVAYATPFTTTDPLLVSRTIDELAEKFPAIQKTFASYNQVFLSAQDVLDSYQMFTRQEVRSLDGFKGMKVASAGFNLRYLPPTGAVGVAGSLNNYYNMIQTGVVDGCMLWAEAASTFKLAEVAPYMMQAQIGTMNSKVVTVNADTWKRMPPQVQRALKEVAVEYRDRLAKLAADLGDESIAAYKKAGGKVYVLPQAERTRWARSLPNLAKEWATGLDEDGLNGTEMLKHYMDRMRAANQPIERHWDRE